MTNIYEAVGGLPALEVAVERFYERVTADPELASFFVGMNLQRLKAHQVGFLAQALGGPTRYNGRSMQRAHAHLNIEQRHFDAVAGHLMETLQELGVPDSLRAEVGERLAPLAAHIVQPPSREAVAVA